MAKDTLAYPMFSEKFINLYNEAFKTFEGRRWLKAQDLYDLAYESKNIDKDPDFWSQQAQYDLRSKIQHSPEFAELFWSQYPQYSGSWGAILQGPNPQYPVNVKYTNWDPRVPYGGYTPGPLPEPEPTPKPKAKPSPSEENKIRNRKWQRQTLLTSPTGAKEEENTTYKRKRLLGSGY